MYLSDDVVKVIGQNTGNSDLLACLVLKNGDDFSNALLKTTVLDDFCDLAWKYGDDTAKLLVAGDDVVSAVSKLDADSSERLSEIVSKNGHLEDWANLIVKNDGLNCKEANIIGTVNTELDEVDFVIQIIYEDKNASGLYVDNPAVPQTEAEWAEKQIWGKGGNRIEALLQEDYRVVIKENDVSVDYSYTISELKSIRDYVFRINADTPELREAVEACLEQLRGKYSTFKFSAEYGV